MQQIKKDRVRAYSFYVIGLLKGALKNMGIAINSQVKISYYGEGEEYNKEMIEPNQAVFVIFVPPIKE